MSLINRCEDRVRIYALMNNKYVKNTEKNIYYS